MYGPRDCWTACPGRGTAPEPRGLRGGAGHPGPRAGTPDARGDVENAGDRRPDPEQPCAALLRGTSGEGPDGAERQRPGVLRPRGPAPLLFLQLEEIERRKTKLGRPQSNGFIERFHRTLRDEHLTVKGRTTWYESVDEMQADLDAYIETYNRNRPHRGPGMQRRTPYQVFKKGIREPRSRKKSTKRG